MTSSRAPDGPGAMSSGELPQTLLAEVPAFQAWLDGRRDQHTAAEFSRLCELRLDLEPGAVDRWRSESFDSLLGLVRTMLAEEECASERAPAPPQGCGR